MIVQIDFINNEAVTYTFNQDFNPISDFNVDVDMQVDDSRPIPQAHGIYPTPTYRRGMTLDVEGTILGDDFADYSSKRQAMVNALFGSNFDDVVTEYKLGVLSLDLAGETENWNTNVTVRAFSAPKTWTEGAYSPYLITFFSWNPYFIGNDTPSNQYRWS